MHFHEKLRVMRTLKRWSQEEMAEKLGYSVSGYSKLERGKTQVDTPKTEKIIEMMGTDWQKLEDLLETINEGNVFNLAENCNNGNIKCHIFLSETQCAHELEKAHLLLQERDKEINYLKRENKHFEEENTRLKEMIELMKTTTSI